MFSRRKDAISTTTSDDESTNIENAISTLDPIRSQVAGDSTPVADRGMGSIRAPAYDHPQVISLHQQHNTMRTLQELRSRNQSQSPTQSVNNPASTPGESQQSSALGPRVEQTNATYLGE